MPLLQEPLSSLTRSEQLVIGEEFINIVNMAMFTVDKEGLKSAAEGEDLNV